VILRDKDLVNGWSGTSDGVLEDRVDFCQNWRQDVALTLDSGGTIGDSVKYRAYGSPFGCNFCCSAWAPASADSIADSDSCSAWNLVHCGLQCCAAADLRAMADTGASFHFGWRHSSFNILWHRPNSRYIDYAQCFFLQPNKQ
jgi:hypothetical protein